MQSSASLRSIALTTSFSPLNKPMVHHERVDTINSHGLLEHAFDGVVEVVDLSLFNWGSSLLLCVSGDLLVLYLTARTCLQNVFNNNLDKNLIESSLYLIMVRKYLLTYKIHRAPCFFSISCQVVQAVFQMCLCQVIRQPAHHSKHLKI